MKALGFVALLIVMAIGLNIFLKQTQSVSPDGTAPTTTIDVTGVRNDLVAMANSERRYWATNGKYASLEELRANGDGAIPTRPNYTYTIEAGDNNFRIVATYSGPDPNAPKQLTIDETMEIK